MMMQTCWTPQGHMHPLENENMAPLLCPAVGGKITTYALSRLWSNNPAEINYSKQDVTSQ